ncbi:transposase [Lactococcus garvieae]
MYELDSPITSIAGIGEWLGATILSKKKNINNFKNPAQLQSYHCQEFF